MMSEKLKTIKELADEIGVSKQAVWQKIKKESSIDLRQFTSKKGNTVYVDVDGQKVIKNAFFNKTSTLQDKKLLEEYKSEINELKALKMPQEDMKDGSSIRGEAQEEIERLKAQLKLSEEERNKAKEKDPVKTESKKWWQLWK